MTRRMTAADFVAAHNRANRGTEDKGRVRGAKPEVVDGIRFASRLEARRWQFLSLLASSGRITGLRRQVPIVLQGRDGPILTPTGRPMRYIADFTYHDAKGAEVIEDAKGHQTDVSQIKMAILAAQGITVRLIREPGAEPRPDGTGKWTHNGYRALRDRIIGEDAD